MKNGINNAGAKGGKHIRKFLHHSSLSTSNLTYGVSTENNISDDAEFWVKEIKATQSKSKKFMNIQELQGDETYYSAVKAA